MKNVLMTCSSKFFYAYPRIEDEITELNVNFKKILSEKPIPTVNLLEHVNDIDVYIVAVENVNKEVMDHANKLKYIIKYGVGTDNIDLLYAKEKGIIVTNAPAQNSSSVADMVMALTLALARKIIDGNEIVKNHKWELLIGNELNNKVMGVIGLGSIGKQVVTRAKAFGMKIIVNDIYQDTKYVADNYIQYLSKEQLFKESDFIAICVSLNNETKNMISKLSLIKMKRSAKIINTSRGPIINEDDLIWALNNDIIAGAALDVFNQEPPNELLIKAKNVILTPHIAGSTYEAAQNLGRITVNNLSRFLNDEPLRFMVIN